MLTRCSTARSQNKKQARHPDKGRDMFRGRKSLCLFKIGRRMNPLASNRSVGRSVRRLGLEENRARARTEAKRLKSSLPERGNPGLPSEFEDFSRSRPPSGLASDFLRSLDLFVHFYSLGRESLRSSGSSQKCTSTPEKSEAAREECPHTAVTLIILHRFPSREICLSKPPTSRRLLGLAI